MRFSPELYLGKRTLTYFIRGSITEWLASCMTGLDSAALLMINQQQIYLFSQNQTSHIGDHTYSGTSPDEVSECFLFRYTFDLILTVFSVFIKSTIVVAFVSFSSKKRKMGSVAVAVVVVVVVVGAQ